MRALSVAIVAFLVSGCASAPNAAVESVPTSPIPAPATVTVTATPDAPRPDPYLGARIACGDFDRVIRRFERYGKVAAGTGDVANLMLETAGELESLAGNNPGVVLGPGAGEVREQTIVLVDRFSDAALAAIGQQGGVNNQEYSVLAFEEVLEGIKLLQAYCAEARAAP